MSAPNDWADVDASSQSGHLPENDAWARKEWRESTESPFTSDKEKACCFVCEDNETDSKLIELPCYQHHICHDCFRRAVEYAVGNETVYPIPCADVDYCGAIPDWKVEDVLSYGTKEDRILLEKYQAKVEEYSTPAAFRTYCASTACQLAQGQARFLDAKIMGDDTAVLCSDCSCVTCRRCKNLVVAEQDHVCNTDDHDAKMRAYIDGLPEDTRWLWQKCPHCSIWVEKTEACNHMTCLCGGQFCLVCGRKWVGLVTCEHGCPHYATPTYDSEGYCEQTGFHRETGLDRSGNSANPDMEHEQDHEYDDYYNDEYDNDYEEPVYGEDGFNQWDRDIEGYNRQGLDNQGISREGWDVEGFGRDGYNAAGFGRNGFNNRMMDSEDFFDDGYDFDGFNRDYVSMSGWPREYYDSELYDPFGYDPFGYSRSGLDFELRDLEGYTVEGYDSQGYDRSGYDAPAPRGFSSTGRDRRGRDRQGYSALAYSAHHRSRTGTLEPGYSIGPNGNVRFEVDEGPSAEVMECEHRAGFSYGSARCYICCWTSDIFHQHCTLCGEDLCRACNGRTYEGQRDMVRRQYLWPGSDSFGVKEMIERVEQVMVFVDSGKKKAVVSRRRSFSVHESKHWVDRLEAIEEQYKLAM